MTLPTALGIAPLKWRDVLTTNAAANMGHFNIYDTRVAGTPLAIPLPAVSTVGSLCHIEKLGADTTTNALTFTPAGADTFTDGSASITLTDGGEKRTLEVVDVSGTMMWKEWSASGRAFSGSAIRALVHSGVTTVSAPTSPQTVNCDVTTVAKFTSIAAALTVTVSGTFYDEQQLAMVFTDNGTSQRLWFDPTKFTLLGNIDSFPTVTPAGRRMRTEFIYDAGYGKFVLTHVDTIGY